MCVGRGWLDNSTLLLYLLDAVNLEVQRERTAWLGGPSCLLFPTGRSRTLCSCLMWYLCLQPWKTKFWITLTLLEQMKYKETLAWRWNSLFSRRGTGQSGEQSSLCSRANTGLGWWNRDSGAQAGVELKCGDVQRGRTQQVNLLTISALPQYFSCPVFREPLGAHTLEDELPPKPVNLFLVRGGFDYRDPPELTW